MKLRSEADKAHFLVEVNRLDLLTEDIPPEVFEIFLQKRRPLVKKLRDFKKSQNSRLQWKNQKWKLLKGIRSFHKSTKGKRFHRSLGRFLATRIFRPKRESLELLREHALKAISSIRTHLYIESGYYMSLDEEAELHEFIEYAVRTLTDIELRFFEDTHTTFTDEEMELLLRLVDSHELKKAYENVLGVDISEELAEVNESTKVEEDDSFYEVTKLGELKVLLGKV